ncbi:TRAP-type C4-dicarboxylate transport system substrate-binding protein [Amorphus suaedae]
MTYKTLAALVGGVACAVAFTSVAGAKEYLYGSFLPPQSNVHKYGVEPFIEEVRTQTDGSVDFSLRTGGQLFNARETLRSVGGRVADAGVVIMSFNQTELKNVFTIVDMAMMVEDPLAAQGAVLETIYLNCPECLKDFKKNDVVLLATYGLTPYAMMCNTDVAQLADVAGKRVRTSGPNARWAKAMNASPVGMSSSDMIEAIQRGQIDCIIGPTGWITNYKIEADIKSIIDFPMGVYMGAAHVILNRDVWSRFSDSEKEAMLAAAPEAISGATILGYFAEGQAARAAAAENGIAIHPGGAEFADLLTEFKKEEMDAIRTAAEERGVKDPDAIIDAFLKNVEKWNGIMAAANIDRDDLEAADAAYSKILWDELYSKLDPDKI